MKKERNKNINQKGKKQVYTRLKLRRLWIEISPIRLEFSHFEKREGEEEKKRAFSRGKWKWQGASGEKMKIK